MIHTSLAVALGLFHLSFSAQSTLQGTAGAGGRTALPPSGGAQPIQFGGGVPSDYMILGETKDSPPGYTFAGLYPRVLTGEAPSWSTGPSIPVGAMGAAVVQVGTDLYVLGGNNGSYLNTVWKLDTLTNLWSFVTTMSTARSALLAVELGGKIYAIGGEVATNVPTGVVEAYDLTSQTWGTPPPPPLLTPRAHLTGGVVNSRIYAIGGIIGAAVQSSNEEYNPVSNAWSVRAAMLTPRSHMGGATYGGHIYTIGGWSGSAYVGTNDSYDPATNTWQARGGLLNARGSLGAVAANGKLYAIGGQASGAVVSLGTVEEYEPLYDYWYEIQPMPTPRSALGAATLPSGEIYTIAGNAAFSPSNKVEVYDSGFRMLYAHRKN